MKLSRSYYESLLYDLLKPFVNLYDEAESSIIIPNEIEVSYDTRTMRLESFSRSLLGWSMLPGHEDIKRVIFTMIKNRINSKCNKYWGEIYDNDQKIVEIFPILLYCIENRNLFESLFDEQSRNNLQEWCLQINKVQVPINNWQFFIVLVNTFLRILGLKYSKNSIEHAFENIEKMYIGDGWYSDGNSLQRDYYIPFALHYYSLLYAKYCPEDKRSITFIKRSTIFSKSFMLFFSNSGNAIPFGRSLTYKFAQVAFWSIYSNFIEDKEVLSVIKGIIERNIKWWMSQKIFDSNGFLNIGYCYTNQFMSEFYNAKGSSYWCLKSFIFLLNSSDYFFKIDSSKLENKNNTRRYIPAIFSTIMFHQGHSYMFMNGQKCNNEFGNTEAKYEKFLYTTHCAPCVCRSVSGIENLACDNSLIIKIGQSFIIRKNSHILENNEHVMVSEWKPFNDVSIITYIFPNVPYHYRIHVVNTKISFKLYDFGTAVCKNNSLIKSTKDNKAFCYNTNQISGIYTLFDNGFSSICDCSPNVNLQYPKVVIPYTCTNFEKGKHYIVNCCYNGIAEIENTTKIQVKTDGIFYENVFYPFKETYFPNNSLYSKAIQIARKLKTIISYFK